MIPKVEFIHSSLYDERLKLKRGFKMPSEKVFDGKIKELERDWRKWGEKILRELEEITKLKWREKDIDCYITAGVVPYSYPLTLNLKSDIDILTHELIHRLLSEGENFKLIKRNWRQLMQKYSKEKPLARIHVPIHAIHEHIFRELFGEKRLKREIQWSKSYPDYRRAWKIVEKEGHKTIIGELTKGLRS